MSNEILIYKNILRLYDCKKNKNGYKIVMNWKQLLSQFLEEITLMSDADRDDETEKVKMMTIHASKWLEFPMIFVVWLEEWTFPSWFSGEVDPDELEEERRLMYVAVTRAKDKLILSHCETRKQYNKTLYLKPSRFLGELPQELLKDYDLTSHLWRNNTKSTLTAWEKAQCNFNRGDRVTSRLFGEWTVVDTRRDIVIVVFDKKVYWTRKIDQRMLEKIS